MFKNALVSVSDKTGLLDFLKPLAAQGMRIVSTGGTADYLRQNGLTAVDVSKQTDFPEVMGGRVKTLHPRIHMALLANLEKQDDVKVLADNKVESFDLVIVNLYPFAETLKSEASFDQLVEKIDVGGPSMLRAAAKNFKFKTVLCDPKDYQWVGALAEAPDFSARQKLAGKVFQHLSGYDALISHFLLSTDDKGRNYEQIPFLQNEDVESINFPAQLVQKLRYGENSQQKAYWLKTPGRSFGLSDTQILQGKELSYNNLLDLDAAAGLAAQFKNPVCVAVKHNNPCGVAEDQDFFLAVQKALKSDPVSVFGGIIACNRKVGKPEAEKMADLFLECIAAPDFTAEALDVFSKKKNLRLLQSQSLFQDTKKWELKGIRGGYLIQQSDSFSLDTKDWKFFGDKPSAKIMNDIFFGEKVCGYLKSNSIAIVAHGQSLGLGMGQVNRVDSVHQALERAQKFHWKDGLVRAEDSVLVSDAFFPFADSVELIAKSGIRWIVQPGGSLKDQEVLDKSKGLSLNMILTGQRHFRH